MYSMTVRDRKQSLRGNTLLGFCDDDPNIYFHNLQVKELKFQDIILWKHHVKLLSQSFRSVSSDLHQC